MNAVPETLMYQKPNGEWLVTRANTFNVLDNGTLMLTLVTDTGQVKADAFGDKEPVLTREHVLTVAGSAWSSVCSTAEQFTFGRG